MTRHQEIRHKMFRQMVRNVITALKEEHKITKPNLGVSNMRMLWLTANNCAHMQMGTEAIRQFRRELMI